MSYTIRTDKLGSKQLEKSGRLLVCPFQPVHMIKIDKPEHVIGGGQAQVIQKAYYYCCDSCPLFNLNAEENEVTLHCGNGRHIQIDKPEGITKPIAQA